MKVLYRGKKLTCFGMEDGKFKVGLESDKTILVSQDSEELKFENERDKQALLIGNSFLNAFYHTLDDENT